MKLYEISYFNHAGVPSIIHVNANDSETARAWFEACECENGEVFCGIREGASSSRPGVPVRTVPADWQQVEDSEIIEQNDRFAEVRTMAAAWRLADKLFPTDYAHDSSRSERAGYPIYHSTAYGVSAYICDLGDRLELNFPDGHSFNIWVRPETVEVCPYADRKCGDHAQCSKCSRGEVNTDDVTEGAPLTLAALIPLKSKVCVYVPSTVNVNEEIDSSPYVERVARFLSESFGGATASPVSGYWVAADKSLVVEHTTMVFAYCSTDDARRYIDDVVRLCYSLKREMGQEAIALEYNNEMYFI